MTLGQTWRAIAVALVVSFLVSIAAASVLRGDIGWPQHFSIVDQTSATGAGQ